MPIGFKESDETETAATGRVLCRKGDSQGNRENKQRDDGCVSGEWRTGEAHESKPKADFERERQGQDNPSSNFVKP